MCCQVKKGNLQNSQSRLSCAKQQNQTVAVANQISLCDFKATKKAYVIIITALTRGYGLSVGEKRAKRVQGMQVAHTKFCDSRQLCKLVDQKLFLSNFFMGELWEKGHREYLSCKGEVGETWARPTDFSFFFQPPQNQCVNQASC